MGKKSKDKGYRGERYAVDKLTGGGIKAKRVPMSGALVDLPGDIMVDWLGEMSDFESKWRASGFKELYKWLKSENRPSRKVRGLFIKADRQEGLVVLRISDFIQLLSTANERLIAI